MADDAIVTFTPRVRGLTVPQDMICPMSKDIMVHPVRVDGIEGCRNVYEREWIQHWFDLGRGTDPVTGKRLNSTNLVDDRDMRVRIAQFRDMNADIMAQLEVFEERMRRCQLAAEAGSKSGSDSKTATTVPWEYLCTLTHSVTCYEFIIPGKIS